jgi:hypothetical protein
MLIIVQGLDWANFLLKVREKPENMVTLNVANRLVYSSNIQQYMTTMFHYDNYNNTKQAFDDFFGFVTNPAAPYATPHFVGEFSTGPSGWDPMDKYWIYLGRYINERSLNWAFWSWMPEPAAQPGSMIYNQGSNSSGIVDATL